MVHYSIGGEFIPAKELREIAEEHIGAVAYHIPLESVIQELRKHGFIINVVGTH